MAAVQRPFVLAVTKAYRTTPTAALQVLGGIPDTRGAPQKLRPSKKSKGTGILRTTSCNTRNTLEVITGIGIVVREEECSMVEHYRFKSKMQTEQAEKMVVLKAIKKFENVERDLILHTDRLELANKLTQGKLTTDLDVDIWRTIDGKMG